MDSPTVNVLSFCSGYGGLDLGVDLATGGATRVVCHVEREAFAASVLAARMAEEVVAPAPVWSDLRTFDGRPWRGVVDLITGGYPCQPFSHAGKRLGEQDERHLWPDIARVIGEVVPGIVFFENVAGHLTLGFDAVRADLERLGYRVAAGLFSAVEVGASHRRERLFILGVADGNGGRCEGVGQGGICDWRHDVNRRDGADAELADASHDHGRRRVGGEEEGVGPHQWRKRLAGGKPDVADALHDHGRPRSAEQAEGTQGSREGRGPAVGGHALDLFPPGPGERARWADIIANRPDLAPATQRELRRVVDGRAPRLDRLRALGNGVVPLVAAYAFTSLWACLFHGEGE